MTDAEIAGYMDWRGPGAYTKHHMKRLKRIIEEVQRRERKAMMQLFTDPENQPTQHGTVTVEYMQREIAAEREARIAAQKQVEALQAENARNEADRLAAVLSEREACAKVCESRQTPGTASVAILNGAVDAIRARGQA